MRRIMWVIMLLGVTVFRGNAVASTDVPGSYAVTITGKLANGHRFVKLAMYSFQGAAGAVSGTMREDFWYWDSSLSASEYGNTSRQIGSVGGNRDASFFVQGMLRFHNTPLTVLFGTWTRQSNNRILIRWSWGDWEKWRVTWKDSRTSPTLHKIEFVGASYIVGPVYLDATTLIRDDHADNYGWGFGNPGWGFRFAQPLSHYEGRTFRGVVAGFNSWDGSGQSGCQPVMQVPVEEEFGLAGFRLSSTGTYRLSFVDGGLDVLAYFAKPTSNPGMLARRVMYQISHDFNDDGDIVDEKGHTYSGLQIIDAHGTVRGIVFADLSTAFDACPLNHTVRAMYYLDVYDCDAMYGVFPGVSSESCPQ